MKNLFFKIAAVLGSILLLAACTTDTESQYVELGQVSCTFLADADQPVVISVKAFPGAWTATAEAGWLHAERTDEKTLTLTADYNDTGSERSATVTIVAGDVTQTIKVNQLSEEAGFPRFRMADRFELGAAMSPNGRYVGGFSVTYAPDDSPVYHPTVIDVFTGEQIQHGPYPKATMALHQTMAVSDDGTLFINDGENGGQVVHPLHDAWYWLPSPDGFECKPEVYATSLGGQYWVGFCKKKPGLDFDAPDAEDYLTYPILWTDGQPEALPLPEKNFRDEPFWYGIMARGISADGSVIYGTTWENWDCGMVYWKKGASGQWEVEYVGKDVREVTTVEMEDNNGEKYNYNLVNGMMCEAELTNISPSGKWIAGKFREETLNDDKKTVANIKYAAFYNTETETTTIVKDYGETGGVHATDDGIAFITIGTFAVSAGKVYDLNTGSDLGDTADWVFDNYGVIIPTGYIIQVNPEKNVLFGRRAVASAGGVGFPNWYLAPPAAEE